GGVDGQVRTGSGRPIGRSRVNRGCPERSRTGRRQNQTLALARPEQVFCLATSPAWILSCVLILPSSSIQRRDGGSNNASNLRPLHSALLLLLRRPPSGASFLQSFHFFADGFLA